MLLRLCPTIINPGISSSSLNKISLYRLYKSSENKKNYFSNPFSILRTGSTHFLTAFTQLVPRKFYSILSHNSSFLSSLLVFCLFIKYFCVIYESSVSVFELFALIALICLAFNFTIYKYKKNIIFFLPYN